MRVISVRNVHQALPEGLRLLKEMGVRRNSRNGPVIVAPFPVSTVYSHPRERVLFWPQRDANPFLHLYESLWMLSGRNDVDPLLRYAKQFAEYSDDGKVFHGAYGYRWKRAFGLDQIDLIVRQLAANPESRREVLQMWDTHADLSSPSKDIPCNLVITFQCSSRGDLDMVVFNRSNDIIWGAYGANAVHFSMLQEYIAHKLQRPVGTYTQVSVNYHAYCAILERMAPIPPNQGIYGRIIDPYSGQFVRPTPLEGDLDYWISLILYHEPFETVPTLNGTLPGWVRISFYMLHAHRLWMINEGSEKYSKALELLECADPGIDWIAAGLQWIRRRKERWEAKGGKS